MPFDSGVSTAELPRMPLKGSLRFSLLDAVACECGSMTTSSANVESWPKSGDRTIGTSDHRRMLVTEKCSAISDSPMAQSPDDPIAVNDLLLRPPAFTK